MKTRKLLPTPPLPNLLYHRKSGYLRQLKATLRFETIQSIFGCKSIFGVTGIEGEDTSLKSGLCHCIALVEATIFWFVEVVETVAVAVAVIPEFITWLATNQPLQLLVGSSQKHCLIRDQRMFVLK